MEPLNVLIGCERSGTVRDAFRALGHNAWSNDLAYDEDTGETIVPEGIWDRYHLTGDVRTYLYAPAPEGGRWDLFIAHPPCTYLANSGSKHLYIDMKAENGRYEPRWENMRKGAAFYREMYDAPVDHVCVENPVMVGHARELIGRLQHVQTIQPHMFGHLEVKATMLALRGLPPLVPTNDVKTETMALPYAERAKVHYASPGKDRRAKRSKTYDGIAEAMAAQWGAWVQAKR